MISKPSIRPCFVRRFALLRNDHLWEAWIRSYAQTIYHPVSSCAINQVFWIRWWFWAGERHGMVLRPCRYASGCNMLGDLRFLILTMFYGILYMCNREVGSKVLGSSKLEYNTHTHISRDMQMWYLTRIQFYLCFGWFEDEKMFSQWPTFKPLGITYLIGQI